jgi:hypothetical protein
LADAVEIRSERDRLEHAKAHAVTAHSAVRNELAEREVRAPSAWVQGTFGERPDEPRQREAWESGVRWAARYRIQYEITDTRDAIGPRPELPAQQGDWERACEGVGRSERRLGRGKDTERDVELGIGL